jgi:membrane-associated PAP2 superfamily phosphatase
MSDFKNYRLELNKNGFLKTHFILPFLVFLILLIGIELSDIDLSVSQNFYDSQLKQWTYKDNWITSTLLHSYGGKFTKILIGMMFVALLATRFKKDFYHYSVPVAFLFFTSAIGPCLVIFLKNKTHIYCPWDLVLFGGTQPYIRLFDSTSNALEIGHCFPAAHASGGFTFMSFYFFFMLVQPRYKYYGLFFGVFLGLTYGFDQQIRGAHFLSHDLFSIAICWFSSVLLFFILLTYSDKKEERSIYKDGEPVSYRLSK